MKRALCVLAVLIVLLAGCSGVIMNAEYSQLLDKTAALSAETADVWQKFKDARDGKASD